MSNMARIDGNIVIEVLKPVDGFDIADCFHPDILVGCIPVGDDVQAGWIMTEDGLTPPPPVEEAPVEEVPTDTPPTA